jgi:hypothetical protein
MRFAIALLCLLLPACAWAQALPSPGMADRTARERQRPGRFPIEPLRQGCGRPALPFARERASDIIYAVDYGVKCDGATDDAAAIMAATNKAASLRRDVILPAGTCRILNVMAPPSHTHWRSYGGTTIYLDPAMTTGHPVGGTRNGIAFDGVSDILFDGIVFKGGGPATAPCPAPCPSSPRVIFQRVSNVRIRDTTFRDFGHNAKDSAGNSVAYIQGLLAFAGSDWLIDKSSFVNNSGDGLAFSDGVTNVEVRGSTFANNGDSALVCTIGGAHHNYHGNYITGQEGNISPIVVMDSCSKWSVLNNQVLGYTTGQGIRVARYFDRVHVNQDFTIAGNTVIGSATGISVEASASKQGANGTSAGGGRFAVTGNTVVNAASTGIAVSDSEVGTVTGNTVVGAPNDGIVVIAYAAGVKTGSLAISGNTIQGGTYGIRQFATGGSLTPSAVGQNVIVDAATPYALLAANTPPTLPFRTPAVIGDALQCR